MFVIVQVSMYLHTYAFVAQVMIMCVRMYVYMRVCNVMCKHMFFAMNQSVYILCVWTCVYNVCVIACYVCCTVTDVRWPVQTPSHSTWPSLDPGMCQPQKRWQTHPHPPTCMHAHAFQEIASDIQIVSVNWKSTKKFKEILRITVCVKRCI